METETTAIQPVAPLRALADQPVTPQLVYDLVLSGRSEFTIRGYAAVYEAFAKAVGCPDGKAGLAWLFGLTPGAANGIVSGYRNMMLADGKSPATVNQHVSALRSIVKEARRFGLINWSLEVRGVRSEKYRDTAGPGHQKYKEMLAKIVDRIQSKGGRDPQGLRDLAIVRLLYDTALRCKEVYKLDLADVDFERSLVWILAKRSDGEKTQISLPKPTLKAVKDWVEVRGTEPGPLWKNLDRAKQNTKAGRRLSRHGIYTLVVRHAKSLGIHVTPHGLRHSAVTRASEITQDLVKVQEFSRHTDLNTVKIYVDRVKNQQGEIASMVAED